MSRLLVVGESEAASLADWKSSAWRAGSPFGNALIRSSKGVIGTGLGRVLGLGRRGRLRARGAAQRRAPAEGAEGEGGEG